MSNELSGILGSVSGSENAPTRLPQKVEGLNQRPAPTPTKPKTLDDHWVEYSKQPSQQAMADILSQARPVIDSAITSYTGGNKNLYGHAKSMAIDAIKSFDPTKGAKLQTHLMSQLRPLSRLHAETSSSIRVPERIRADLYRVNQNHQEFFDEQGREPSDQELADRTGLSMKRISHVRKYSRAEVNESSLTGKTEDGDDETFYPGTETKNPKDIWMEYVHHDSTPIDQKIMEWRYGFNGKETLSTGEIAKRLNLTPSAVSQRSAKLAARMREGEGTDGY